VKYKIKFKSQNTGYGESHYSFSPLPRDAFKTCSECKTFPYCVVLHNSGFRYKSCPCINCIVKVMCSKQCEKFKNEVSQIFKLKIETDYKEYYYGLFE
jgi:hypothetical protein